MADAVTAGRKPARKAASAVERLCHALWVTEGRASVASGSGTNAEAEDFAAALGRILVDRLQPAVEALRKLGAGAAAGCLLLALALPVGAAQLPFPLPFHAEARS